MTVPMTSTVFQLIFLRPRQRLATTELFITEKQIRAKVPKNK